MNTLAKSNQPYEIEVEVNILTKRMLTYHETSGVNFGKSLTDIFTDDDLETITPVIYGYIQKYNNLENISLLDYLLDSPYFSNMYVTIFRNAMNSGQDITGILRSLLSIASFESKFAKSKV
jgi:hypothetical protein